MKHTYQFDLAELLRQTDNYLDSLEQLNKAYPVFDQFINQLRMVKTHFLDIQLQRDE